MRDFAAAASASSADAPPPLLPADPTPSATFPEAKGNGSLGYRFAIDLPAFRGLEPKIALDYSSARKTKTGGLYQGWSGYGWSLDGFDVVERMRPRMGVPPMMRTTSSC